MTILHLVRHGAHDLLGRVLVGRGPVELNQAGQAEAAAVGRALATQRLDAVFSSPCERAMQTAAAIAAASGLPVAVEPGLDELDMGEWTGAAFDTLRRHAGWADFNQFRGTTRIPGGETLPEVQARAGATLIRLHEAHPAATLALVSHADVIKAMLVLVLGMPLDLMARLEVAPGSRSVVELQPGQLVVRAINLPALA